MRHFRIARTLVFVGILVLLNLLSYAFDWNLHFFW